MESLSPWIEVGRSDEEHVLIGCRCRCVFVDENVPIFFELTYFEKHTFHNGADDGAPLYYES